MSPPFSAPGGSSSSQTGPGALSRPSEKVAPPQKVIKALATHRSTNPQQLSYTKGDFWYVTGEREGWFEALSTCLYLQWRAFLTGRSDYRVAGASAKGRL